MRYLVLLLLLVGCVKQELTEDGRRKYTVSNTSVYCLDGWQYWDMGHGLAPRIGPDGKFVRCN